MYLTSVDKTEESVITELIISLRLKIEKMLFVAKQHFSTIMEIIMKKIPFTSLFRKKILSRHIYIVKSTYF